MKTLDELEEELQEKLRAQLKKQSSNVVEVDKGKIVDELLNIGLEYVGKEYAKEVKSISEVETDLKLTVKDNIFYIDGDEAEYIDVFLKLNSKEYIVRDGTIFELTHKISTKIDKLCKYRVMYDVSSEIETVLGTDGALSCEAVELYNGGKIGYEDLLTTCTI